MAEHVFGGLRCSDVADLAPAFVLDALEAAEADAVRQHLLDCPEAHPEMAEFQSVVPALFEMVELVTPPASLKARILAAAAADTQRLASTERVADTPRLADTQVVGRDVQLSEPARDVMRPRVAVMAPARGWGGLFRRPVWAAVSLAAALAVVALGVWNVQLQNELAGLTAYRNGVVEVLDEATQPGAQLAVLVAPEGGGPSGLAAVAANGSVALVMRELAPTTGTQVYETWLIGGDGTPVAIGGFTVTASGSASFVTANASVSDGVVVALTLEPGPGATAPGGPIVAAGKAQAQAS